MNHPAHHPEIPNHLIWAILSTLFCCLPLGIVSIVHASKVDGLRLAGNYEGAREMSRKALNWAIYSAVALPVVVVLWILFAGGLTVLGGLAGA